MREDVLDGLHSRLYAYELYAGKGMVWQIIG